jgi:hypothetical protein
VSAIASARTLSTTGKAVWINNRGWDLSLLFLSCLLVLGTYALYRLGVERLVVNMAVTLLVGGPHMFSTYTRTAMEPRFIRRYPMLFFGSITLIPAFVIITGTVAFPVLLTAFFIVASIHVAEQFSYIAAAYARKAGYEVSVFNRFLDGGLILMSLHMPALYLLTKGSFFIGDQKLLFPAVLQMDIVWIGAVSAWAALFVAFLWRTATEVMEGVIVWPKLLFIAITIPIALYIPTLENLDVAFQGMNAWHSFQYLALIWFISRVRHDRNEVSLDFVIRLTKKGNFPLFYGFCFALTAASAAVIMVLSRIIGFPYEQSYYLVVLSFLLVHYAFDHILFTDYKDFVRES